MPSLATRSAESMVNPVPITGTWNRCSDVSMDISSEPGFAGLVPSLRRPARFTAARNDRANIAPGPPALRSRRKDSAVASPAIRAARRGAPFLRVLSGARVHPLARRIAVPRRARAPRGASGLRPGARRVRLPVSGPAIRAPVAAPGAAHEPIWTSARAAQRARDRSPARQELLRRRPGRDHPRAERGRLSRGRSRPGRLLQVEQARALPVQLPAAGREYPRAACRTSASSGSP